MTALSTLLIDLTIRGTLAGLGILAVDLTIGRWLMARHLRWLWLLAPVAFLIPPSFPVPIFHVSISPPANGNPVSLAAAALPQLAPAGVAAVHWEGLFAIWALGATAGTLVVLIRTIRTSRQWSETRFSTDARLLEIVEDCRRIARVRGPVGVVTSELVEAPALLGWLRPKVLLPARWTANCPPAQLRDVLLHEFAHLRGADLAWTWLFTITRVIHWFNPVAHVVGRRWHAARENAADEFVLRFRSDGANSYAETLLAFFQSARRSRPFGALGISENLLHLKHRIHMIKAHPRRVLPSFIAMFLVAVLSAAILVHPTQAAPSEADTKAAALVAMTAWLKGIDHGDYAQSWTDASKFFRAALPQDQWVAALSQVRTPLGVCTKRKEASVLLQKGVPQSDGKTLPGEFAIAQFKTSFANLFSALETVTFEHEPDGQWRASGYYIKPAM